MRFVKMHGIGNDYVFVNCFDHTVSDPAVLAVKVADRHRGVGGDGLILVMPPDNGTGAHVRMRMFNADGSEAEMCGNGIRCVCKLAHDDGLSTASPMNVQTVNGVLALRYTKDRRGKVDRVRVDMGEPLLDPKRIPVKIDNLTRIVNHSTRSLIQWPGTLDTSWIEGSDLDQRMTCVSMGNPHAVFFCGHVDRVPLDTVGPALEHHPVFPNRVNVHFVQVRTPTQVTMRTWERGSGKTQACGTGAAAVCVAGVLTDRTQRRILAHLPGGGLELEWSAQDGHVTMTGPAVEVFRGEWPDEDL